MEKLLDILWEINPEVDFQRETALLDNGVLDSFDLVSLVGEIEDVFGVTVPPQYLTREHFNTVQGLYALILHLQEG